MTNVYFTKRNNGIYYYGVKNSNGKITWKSTKQTKESEAKAWVFYSGISHLTQPNKTESQSCQQMSSYILTYQHLRQLEIRNQTMQMTNNAVKYFIRLIGDKELSKYTLEDIEQFKNLLVQDGKAPTSVNIYWRMLKTVFSFAVKHEIIRVSPFKLSKCLKLPFTKVDTLSLHDLLKINEKVNNPTHRDLFTTAVLTGMRLSELLNMKWSDINFTAGVINVVNGGGFLTKNGKERVVPMHQRVIEIISQRKRIGVYVFSKSSGYKYERSFVSKIFKRAAREAQLSERIHFHTTRHSCASLLANSGVNIFDIQKILGHSSVNLTANTYSHLLPSTLVNSINKIVI